jgi:hypothetical protein
MLADQSFRQPNSSIQKVGQTELGEPPILPHGANHVWAVQPRDGAVRNAPGRRGSDLAADETALATEIAGLEKADDGLFALSREDRKLDLSLFEVEHAVSRLPLLIEQVPRLTSGPCNSSKFRAE